MGYMRHHAIVVTSWNDDLITRAHEEATRRFAETSAEVSEVTPVGFNGYRSFFVAPDGSKEGWEHSDAADRARGHYTDWLDRQRYLDGSSAVQWVEVQFGDDELDTRVVNDSDARAREDDAR